MLKRETPETRKLPLGGGRVLAFRGGRFAPEAPAGPVARRWRWREEPDPLFGVRFLSAPPDCRDLPLDRACFDAAKLPPELRIESGRDGEAMTVFGGRRVKWKKLRIDRGVARADAPPLLRLPDGEAIWSPGIRHGAFAPIAPETTAWAEFYLRNPLSEGGTTWQPPNN